MFLFVAASCMLAAIQTNAQGCALHVWNKSCCIKKNQKLKIRILDVMWHHELDISTVWLQAVCSAAGGITFHIWRKQMLRFFGAGVSALSLFPFPSPWSFTPPHIALVFPPIRYVTFSSLLSEALAEFNTFFSEHGGHRGSQLDAAAPDTDSPLLDSTEQRVCLIEERHAAYCWSGKKWPKEEIRKQMKVLVYHCARKSGALRF